MRRGYKSRRMYNKTNEKATFRLFFICSNDYSHIYIINLHITISKEVQKPLTSSYVNRISSRCIFKIMVFKSYRNSDIILSVKGDFCWVYIMNTGGEL